MPFQLNNLVQPECGGSNPLVSVAQQITSRPGTVLHQRNTQAPLNFSAEFVQQNAIAQSNQQPISMPVGLPMGLSMPIASQPNFVQAPHSSHIMPNALQAHQMMENLSLAANQLEAKYRQDMMASASGTSTTSENAQQFKQQYDDLSLWQALAQQYVGPSTVGPKNLEQPFARLYNSLNQVADPSETTEQQDDIIVPRDFFERQDLSESDWEYAFHEKNPFKGQFADPFAEGLKRLEQGDIPSAALLFEAAVQLKPDDSVAWRYLGTTQAQNEMDKYAIVALRNCLKLNLDDQDAHIAITVSLANEVKPTLACYHLLQWLLNNDKYNQTIKVSLDEFEKIKRSEKNVDKNDYYSQKYFVYVEEKFLQAARMSPNNPDPDVQSLLGVIFSIRGSYDKASDCFQSALSVKPNDSLLWNRLGATLANGLKSNEAVAAYRKALELSPGSLRTRYNLAISLVQMNAYKEAAKQLIQVLQIQSAGKGSDHSEVRSVTSTTIWNTFKTVATLMNKPEMYPLIDSRNLEECRAMIYSFDAEN